MDKIIALNHFPVYPPTTGGRVRIYYLMRYLSDYYDVEIISLDNYIKRSGNKIKINKLRTIKISNNFRETLVPENLFSYLFKFIFCWRLKLLDVDACISATNTGSRIKSILRDKIDKNTFLFLEHPFLSTVLDKKVLKNVGNIIYDAHNVEFLLKKQITHGFKKISLSRIYKIEKFACEISDFIFTTSEEDKQAFIEIYNTPEEKLVVIPNGVDCESLSIEIDKAFAKRYFGIDDNRTTVIFMGSGHPPNVEAVSYIVKNLAPKLRNVVFMIIGEVCNNIDKCSLPSNVKLLGVLDSKTKNIALKASDIALNPVTSGSGTNVKMLEYMAIGIPTITTPIGARGLEVENWKHLVIVGRSDFDKALKQLLENASLAKSISKNAKKLVEKKYDWKVISRKVLRTLESLP